MTTHPDTAQRPVAPSAGATRADDAGAVQDRSLVGRLEAFLERIEHPLTTYHMLVAATAALLGLGLVMVESATSTHSYTVFLRQAQYAAVGAVLATVASRVSPSLWRRAAVPLFGLALVLQALVFTPLGVDHQGNRAWVRIAGQELQPSELGKLALIVFGALVLERKRKLLGDVKHVLIPFVVPAATLLLVLQLLGKDLGTGMILLAIVAGMLYAVGLALRWFAAAGGAAVLAVLAMTFTSSNRMGRIDAWLGDGCAKNVDQCRQVNNGFYALAEGGWWGRGLGESFQKWGWLPESGNDFILAIIGEELGLAGTLAVLFLYALLAYACLRLVMRSEDLFVRLASAGVMVWIAVQATINIGAVTGLLPVIGVPLPLISGGGTALIFTLLALGMLMCFARHEPGAQAVIVARRRTSTLSTKLSRPLSRKAPRVPTRTPRRTR